MRCEQAEEAIRNNDVFQATIVDKMIANKAIADLSPKLQFVAMAPWMPLCDGNLLLEDHPVLDLVGLPFVLGPKHREAILDAFATENYANFTPGDFETFYSKFYGAPFLICAD